MSEDGEDNTAVTVPSPPSWTSLSVDDLAAMKSEQKGPNTGENGEVGKYNGQDTAVPATMSEQEQKRGRPRRQRGPSSPSPFALCHASFPAGAKSGSGVAPTEVVISSVIGYALVRLEAHKDKITAATLDNPLSATDLTELNELKEILSAELKTSGRVPSITMRKDARATMSFASSPSSLASSSSGTRQSVRASPQSTNAFALDPAKLTACEPQVLLSLIREYCRVHIRLFPEPIQRALGACLDIRCTRFRLNAIQSLVHFLPSGNRTMMQYLLSFLSNLLKRSAENGITIDSLAIIFGPCLLRSRPEDQDREVELGVAILREMLEHYDLLFVKFKDMTWKAVDGISHLAVAHIEQIVETAVDSNYLEEPFVDILFLTYDYYTTSTRLLNHFIDLYEQSGGKEGFMVDIRMSVLETLDYWVHCFPACFDPAHTFLKRLEEFVGKSSKQTKKQTQSEERTILSSLTQCVKEKADLSEEEKDKEEDEEKKGRINWLKKRRGSQLGNHRLSLPAPGKFSSALRSMHKSGGLKEKKEKKDKKSRRAEKKGPKSEEGNGETEAAEDGEGTKDERKDREKANGSDKKKATKKKGSAIMFNGLESGYKKMATEDDGPEKTSDGSQPPASPHQANGEAGEEQSNQRQTEEVVVNAAVAVAASTEDGPPVAQKEATEPVEGERKKRTVTMDATAEMARSAEEGGSDAKRRTEEGRKAQLERSVTISSRTLYAMMGKGFQQMQKADVDDNKQNVSTSSTSESGVASELANGESRSGDEQSPASSPKAAKKKGAKGQSEKDASPRSNRKNENDGKERGGSPRMPKRKGDGEGPTEDSSTAAGGEGGGKRDSGEKAKLKASPRTERRLGRRTSRADLNSGSLSSSASTTHIRERGEETRVEREVKKDTRERRGSFMIRTLSLSGSFAVPHRSLKEDREDRTHGSGGAPGGKDDRRGSVSLSSGQSWASTVPVHSAKEDIEFLTADPAHIARQLTLLDWELFESIDCGELLKGRFMKPEESPSFAAMVKRFNTTGQWVCCTMLKYDTVLERAKAIEQYIRICAECQKIHNFNSFFAIVGGLNMTAISRLKASWEKVSKRAARQYKELMELASTDGNFWNYRSVLKKTSLPLIPYLAICTQDIFKVEEKQTYVNGGMVYFEKMRLLWHFHSYFRSEPYHFVVDRGMRAFINDFAPLSEKELYNRSYKLEPRSGSGVDRG